MNELIADVLKRNLGMMQMHLEDFSESDMFVRPCENANHAAWQIGHLIASEAEMINDCKIGKQVELPAGFADKFTAETSKSNDPKKFLTKGELFTVFAAVRTAAIQWVQNLSPQDWKRPGPESMRDFVPTVGHTVLLLADHAAMHCGQIQVTRRKLGKPVLF